MELITWLDTTDSTNLEATRQLAHACEGSVWATNFQTAGRGQAAGRWESAAGENLLFSLLLRPCRLPADHQFYISKTVSLGVYDFFAAKGLPTTIKWSNDSYAGDKKIAGILIEHHLSGNALQASIVGIGINLNQTRFVSGAPNPTSFRLETGHSLPVRESLPEVTACIMQRYRQLEQGGFGHIDSDYLAHLYRLGEWHLFEQHGVRFRGKITGVRRSGELSVADEAGTVKQYAFREIRFIH